MSALACWPEEQTEARRRPGNRLIMPPKHGRRREPLAWKLVAAAPAEIPVISYVRPIVESLADRSHGPEALDPGVAQQVLEFLRNVADRATTFPSVVPDEGVAVIHWVAGPLSIQVDVDASGPSYLWRKKDGGDAIVLTDPMSIRVVARSTLQEMSDIARSVNPRWREQFFRR